jgi:hypothetical protein
MRANYFDYNGTESNFAFFLIAPSVPMRSPLGCVQHDTVQFPFEIQILELFTPTHSYGKATLFII